MPLGCWRKAGRVLTTPPRTPTDDRPESSLWGTSRPASEATQLSGPLAPPRRVPRLRLPSPLARKTSGSYQQLKPLPPGPDGLRPLRLVQALEAGRRSPPQQEAEPIELSDLAYMREPDPPEQVPPGSVLFTAEDEVVWPATPQRTHYDVTRPPSQRALARPTLPVGPSVAPTQRISESTPFLGRYPAMPHLPRLPEWADSVPQPATSLPPLAPIEPVMRAAPTQAQHAEVLRHLRAQGSFLPDVLHQAERGHPLMVPPRHSSLPRRL